MAADEKTPYILRPEARPLRWDLLNASQQSAFRKILDALKDARRDVDEAARQKSAENPPNLPANPDRFRSSRLVFVSGKRGTGKSTVLVSLFEAFLDPDKFYKIRDERRDKREETTTTEKAGIRSEESGIDTKIGDSLKELKERLIWLDPLDMEPLPRPVNLLAAILARIDRAATRFNQKKDDKTYQSGLLSLASGEKALHGLRKLAADVAIAWDGNVDARASALDPDAYAAEVNRIEEARVGINMAFTKALDELAQELGKSSYVKNPMFVLPVDDYDLNPLRSLELLHLIRMVSSPRLFIIVLGDVRMAELMFNLKKSGDFAKVLEAAYTPKYLSLSSAEIGGIVRSLSGHAIRKLVPPGQRIELGALQVREALDFHPRHLRNDDTVNDPTQDKERLQDFLEKLPVDIDTAFEPEKATAAPPEESDESEEPENHESQSIAGKVIPNFKEFLCFNVRLHELSASTLDMPVSTQRGQELAEKRHKEKEEQGRTFPYTGAALLKATPRYIADLWFSVRDLLYSEAAHKSKSEWKSRLNMLINLIGKETHRALEEDELLSIRYRERFVEALGVSPDEEWLQAMRFVEARSVSVPGRIVPFRDQNCAVHANYRRSWAFWDLDKDRPIEIAERTKALIVLLHDLLSLERWGGIVGSHSLSPNSLDLGWAMAAWDLGLHEEVKVPWITPPWTSFWEFDQFSHIWESALRSDLWNSGNASRQRALLLYTWIAGICKIFEKSSSPKETGQPGTAEPANSSLTEGALKTIPDTLAEVKSDSKLWDQLASAIHQLILSSRETTPRAERIRNWLIRVPVLLAPESGLLATQAGILEHAATKLLDEAIWHSFLDSSAKESSSRLSSIRSLRADRLAPFMDHKEKLEMLIEETNPNPDHPVNRFFDRKLVPQKEERRQAKERLLKKGLRDSQERIALALEGFTTQLRTAFPILDENPREEQP